MNGPSFATCDSLDSVRQIEQLVARRLDGRAHSVRLEFRENGLILHGRARTYYTKQLAQHAVMELCDFPIRANEIEVA